MKRRSIQLKIQGLVIGSVILTVTVLLAPIFWQKAAMEREVKDQLLETVRGRCPRLRAMFFGYAKATESGPRAGLITTLRWFATS